MKILVFNVEQNSFTLPEGMTGQEFRRFKSRFNFILNVRIADAKNRIKDCTKVMIDIDSLPVLSDSLITLKSWMLHRIPEYKNVSQWNESREVAKMYFSFNCISALDASGFINTVLKTEKV